MLGLIGKKLGMTQMFGKDGEMVAVTVVKAGPCTVLQQKTIENDGYNAVQLGFGPVKPQRVSKAERMHCEKKGAEVFGTLREFKTDKTPELTVGKKLTVSSFKVGDVVEVIGVTKGRGFQGVIKRHGKHGGPASHGSDFHRRTGSIGMRTWPGRVFKNTRLPGHMGVDNITVKNLKVMAVRPYEDVLLLKGAIPGARNGTIVIVNCAPDFETREGLVNPHTKHGVGTSDQGTTGVGVK